MRNDMRQIISGYFKGQPVEKAWLFGSYSRGKKKKKSDIDIMVRFTPDSSIDFLKYSGMIVDLERLLRRKVDLVEESCLCDFAVESFEQDKILFYERA
jgi:predicted nucleotidyltransferase